MKAEIITRRSERTDLIGDSSRLASDVDDVLDTLEGGGVAIIPTCLTYAIVGHRPAAIARIFAAKNRSREKPCGLFGSAALCREIHELDGAKHEIARQLAADGLPFSVVAPYRAAHPFFGKVEGAVFANATKAGTMDMVVSGGPFVAALAARSFTRGIPVFGSSANRSLEGSKYELADIEPEVRAAADLQLDYGTSRWASPEGLSSTIIDFRDFSVVRRGHCFVELAAAFAKKFGITLAA